MPITFPRKHPAVPCCPDSYCLAPIVQTDKFSFRCDEGHHWRSKKGVPPFDIYWGLELIQVDEENVMITRTLSDHIVSVDQAVQLKISVMDEPGQGGANHKYSIRWENDKDETEPHCFIGFQNGPIKENGVNGITNEALMAIVIDRLRGFQEGQFKCRENALALTNMELALMWLQKRTRDRIAKGIEGTNVK